MRFLNSRRTLGRYADVDVAVAQNLADGAAALAGERNDAQIVLVGGIDRFDDVG